MRPRLGRPPSPACYANYVGRWSGPTWYGMQAMRDVLPDFTVYLLFTAQLVSHERHPAGPHTNIYISLVPLPLFVPGLLLLLPLLLLLLLLLLPCLANLFSLQTLCHISVQSAGL